MGEQDLGDIEERINAGDVVNFFSDEMHRLRIRMELHADARGWGDFLALRRTAASILISSAAVISLFKTTSFARTEIAAFTATKFASAAVSPVAAMRTIACREFACRFRRRVVACPGRTQVESAQKVAKGVGIRIAHGAGAYRNSPQ